MADKTFNGVNKMQSHYDDEAEGSKDFYKAYLPRINRHYSEETVRQDYSDGVVNGNIIEFKLSISNLNKVLSQVIRYLSSMRIKGKPIPANILLVSLNEHQAYLYHSSDYQQDIEQVYIGASSKGIEDFVCEQPIAQFNYSNDWQESQMIAILKTENYTPINIDENCIVGWAQTYYKLRPGARKADFIGDKSGKVAIIGEIRRPNVLKRFILPYNGETNLKFEYLMDKLNDVLQKKNLGAFYTHSIYAKKSHDLLRKAIARVPEGNDYVIIDRCAGTGNLEENLTDEELSHVIVSTLEYYEYKVLMEKLGDRVRHIIPPTEHDDTFNMGLVRGADALSEEFVNNEILKHYVDDEKCTIILFENPPFTDTSSIEHQKKKAGKKSSVWKQSFVVQTMKKNVKGAATNELGNAFIWSAFEYYLRQPTDSYVVYSPAKYWKAQHLINKKFIEGYGFNRRHFHRNQNACIMCALWSNEDDSELEKFNIQGYEIDAENNVKYIKDLEIEKIHKMYSEAYFDKRTFDDDKKEGIVCEKNGYEKFTKNSIRVKPIVNDNILGYMAVYSSGFDNPDNMSTLIRAARYDGNGFYLRKDNYLEKLPMFAASRYVTYNRAWTERGRVMKSADGSDDFFRDVRNGKLKHFLLKCLFFTVLEPQNHMLSFKGSDGRSYVNELTFDTSTHDTIASKDIKELKYNKTERGLVEQWNKVLSDAKKTDGYNPETTYGLYQIKQELNESYKDEKTGKKIYKYPSLNGNIQTLAAKVKQYYLNEIVPTLFEYKFLK
ncbi:MAG: hypothetical protein IJV44_00840 [Prevotella sp.]|nr:hypothetical protein [Prevotella sp.]